MGENAIEKGEYVIGIAIILAALMVSATAYMSMNNLQKAIANVKFSSQVQANPNQQVQAATPSQQAAAQPAQNTALPSSLSPTKEVTMDFLYADWCPHCQKMKPIVAALEQALPADRFTIRRWRDEDRQTNSSVSSVFDFYSQKGSFAGFPTFIINGEDAKAGEMPEVQFKAWICSKFKSPAPSGC